TAIPNRSCGANHEGEIPMDARSYDSEEPSTPRSRPQRRGLIASLAAFAMGVLAKSATPVEAQSNPSLQLNQTNNSTSPTELAYNGAPGTNPTLLVRNPGFDGIQSVASGSLSYGVWGDASTGYGVVGTSNASTGVSGGSASGSGVSGDSNTGTGVAGFSDNGYGVYGQSFAPSGASVAGVFGKGTYNPGVRGDATNHYGVLGNGPSYGLVGFGATGVYGESTA